MRFAVATTAAATSLRLASLICDDTPDTLMAPVASPAAFSNGAAIQ